MRIVLLAMFFLHALGCGPACLDDRCSLSPTTPKTMQTDYTNIQIKDAGVVAVAPVGSGSAVVAVGSGSAVPPIAVGSGSAVPPVGAGSGSAVQPLKSATWIALEGDRTKMWVVSTTPLTAGAAIKFDFIRWPEKTPFVISLQTRVAGVAQAEAVWNDCSEGKIRCESGGQKSHAVKRAGQVQLSAGINWALTEVIDQGGATLVTWTNNLSRELVTIKLTR
ncbi:MAG: hypothetical protein ABI867_26525 [Kofleriaceae bacterium]